MELTDAHRGILRDVLRHMLRGGRWPDAHAFKIDHLSQRLLIKELADAEALRAGGEFFELTLYGLFECKSSEADSEVADCADLWPTLQKAFKEGPQRPWTAEELATVHAERVGRADARSISRSLTFLQYLDEPQWMTMQESNPDRFIRAIRLKEDVLDLDGNNWQQKYWEQFNARREREKQAKELLNPGTVELAAPLRRLGLEALHPAVIEAASDLFTGRHYADAVFNAFKAVEVRVRELSGLQGTGQTLMAKAFDEKAPKINVAVEPGQSGKDEQRGFKFLFMGAMVGIRNPKGHGFVQEDPQRTLESLALASLLMRRLDEAAKNVPVR